MTAGPISRILSARLAADRTAIPLGQASLPSSSDLPGGECAPSQHADARSCTPSRAKDPRWGPRGAAPSLFGLAPCGVCPARSITGAAVRSCRTFSPLPRRSCHPPPQLQGVTRTAGRYVFCGTFRQRSFEKRRPDVIRHTALWSSDFPPLIPRSLEESSVRRTGATVRSGCQQCDYSRCCRMSDGLAGGRGCLTNLSC